MKEKIYTIAEMRAANKKADRKFFHKSHIAADRRDGVTTRKDGNIITKVYPDGRSYSYRFIPETGQMRSLKFEELTALETENA